MARWTICWLLLISIATAGSYMGTNALIGTPYRDDGYAMQALGGLGSPECTQAARLLVAAGDGARSNALPDERRAWERAARTVLEACAES